MNRELLEYKRKCAGYRIRRSFAAYIGKTDKYYAARENGDVDFSPQDMVDVVGALCLPFDDFNKIFFDGKLPYGNTEDVSVA